ncbi:type III-B CRISPR-associated protein Cas10/Cmr2 [Candidatus Caldatribacterium saccharofermentans]|uniref:type III-B CRISPR-associated protein Cas10/Cmr2 n=1 Tax=Candidatus Caldatribacterium saccharofermentans TaxID=1454753 RepID=UPI003D0546B3
MGDWGKKLFTFLYEPVDRCIDPEGYMERAKRYRELLGVRGWEAWIPPVEETPFPPEICPSPFKELRHPLSGGRLEIHIDEEKEKILKVFEDAYKELGERFKGLSEEQGFLYLWRNLEEVIAEKSPGTTWGKYLPLFPADTRAPNYAIWERLRILSALEDNCSLFLFSIGPVQSFIAQARKTQDFYLGSYILSYLTFMAIEEVVNRYGPVSIVYPDLHRQPLMDWFLQKKRIAVGSFKDSMLLVPTIPNRFVAIIPTVESDKLKELAKLLMEKVRKSWEDAASAILKAFAIQPDPDVWEKLNSQLQEFPYFHWVAIPWRSDGKDVVGIDEFEPFFANLKPYREIAGGIGGLPYELLYSALERSMGARKNLREFTQPEVLEKGRKCSVCGERDVVFFREGRNKGKFTRYGVPLLDLTGRKEVSLKFLADGEGLCAVCFVKRAFEVYLRESVSRSVFDKLTFPSTAEVACADFKRQVLSQKRKELQEYLKKAKDLFGEAFQEVEPLPKLKADFRGLENLGGEWFYEENLRKAYIEKELGISVDEERLKTLREALKALYETTRPSSYYAVITFDGDDMGRWLSGALLPSIESTYASGIWERFPEPLKDWIRENFPRNVDGFTRGLLTPMVHVSMSRALRNFALEFVGKIVEEEHLGKLVYSGGDDVLAFVNLTDLFSIMRKLRAAFSGHIRVKNGRIEVDRDNASGFVEKDGRYLLTMGPKATGSMGVVIAHYKTPLQLVIRKAFAMERQAKGLQGKDAFAICFMRRSGEERVAKAHWRGQGVPDVIEALEKLQTVFRGNGKGVLSARFVQKVAAEFSRLKEKNGTLVLSQELFESLLKRLLRRSCEFPPGTQEQEKEGFVDEVFGILNPLFWDLEENIDTFVNFLAVVVFTVKEGE